MPNAFRPVFCALFTLAFAVTLASCGRRDHPAVDLRQKEDPRMLKAFAPNEARFCSFTLPSDEGVTRITVLGDSKSDLAANFDASCAKLATDSKAKCEGFAADESSYPCVAPSILHGEAAKTGLWTCTLPFTVSETAEVIEKKDFSTADAAISAVFTACAELTDGDDGKSPATASSVSSDALQNLALTAAAAPSPRPSTAPSTLPSPTPPAPPARTYTTPSKRRDACAAALLDQKLTCVNANDYPAITPSPKPPRRLHH